MMARPERLAWLRLSFALGVPVRRLQAEVSSAEFSEYVAFMATEPQGGARLDYWGARVLSAVLALLGQRTRPVDVLPVWWRAGKVSRFSANTRESITAVFAMFADAHNRSRKP